MGTEVLRPQDCLVDRLRVSPPAFHRRRSSFLAGNGFVSPKPNNRKTANVYRTTTTTTTTEQQPDHRKRKPIKEFQQLQRKPAGSDLSRRRSSSAEDLLQTRISKAVTNLHSPEFEPGRITILRRGQSLESLEKNIQNEALKIKTQNDSEKKVALNIMNHLSTDVYAGSGFFVSPSPNSLPLPSFFSNNKKIESDNCATRDLRRLLGLE